MSEEVKSKKKRKSKAQKYHIVLLSIENGFYAGKLKWTSKYEEAEVYEKSVDAYKIQKLLKSGEIETIMLKETSFRDI